MLERGGIPHCVTSWRLPGQGGEAGDVLLPVMCDNDLPPSYHPQNGVQLKSLLIHLDSNHVDSFCLKIIYEKTF